MNSPQARFDPGVSAFTILYIDLYSVRDTEHYEISIIKATASARQADLKKLGADLADARKRRRISTSTMAQRAMISRNHLQPPATPLFPNWPIRGLFSGIQLHSFNSRGLGQEKIHRTEGFRMQRYGSREQDPRNKKLIRLLLQML